MNQKIHVSHVILYSLYLLQTIATFLFLYASEAVSNVAMYVFCPAVMLMFWYEIGSWVTFYLLLDLFFILRLVPLVLGVVGFWRPVPRKVGLGIATAFTAWEFYMSLEVAMDTNMIAPVLLTVAMLILCIKGFSDVKNEWKTSYKRLCEERRDLPTQEVDYTLDRPNDTP